VSIETRRQAKAQSLVAFVPLAFSIGYLARSLLGYALGGAFAQNAFSILGTLRNNPPFADLKWITVVAHCGTKDQPSLHAASKICAAYGYGVSGGGYPESGYPPMASAILNWLSFPPSSTGTLAFICGTAFVVVLLISSRNLFRSRWSWTILLALILISFPVLLVLERGNLDIIIFLLLTTVAYCTAISFPGRWLVSGLLACLAVSLKIYPVTGFFGWYVFSPLNNKAIIPSSSSVKLGIAVGCGLGLALSVFWINGTESLTASGALNSYGFQALGYVNIPLINAFGLNQARWLIRGLIVAKLLALIAGILITAKARLATSLRSHLETIQTHDPSFGRYIENYLQIMGWTWLGCYFLTISFDYKHIFILPIMFILLSMVEPPTPLSTHQAKLSWTLLALMILLIFYPLLFYNLHDLALSIKTFGDSAVEFVALPFIAGAVVVLLSSHGLNQILSNWRRS
jgi:hypothetical protein